MENRKIKITVLGAGISGLATAYWLNKDGFDVTILEANAKPGGAMQTISENGFLIDLGPNSGLETTPLISQLVEEIGIKEEMVYANAQSKKRYILKKNRLLALPTTPPAFVTTKLFSPIAKLRLLAEPFISKSDDGYYQSISEFVRRRLGNEFLDYAIDPFVSGVFAGDPNKLSVKSAFPKLYRLEEVYGGLIKGLIKGAKERKQSAEQSKQSAKMFSFKSGMQIFPHSIAQKLHKIYYDCSVNEVRRLDKGFVVNYNQDGDSRGIVSDIVLSTIPAYQTSNVFKNLDKKLSKHLNSIYYPPVLVLYLGYNKKSIGQKLDGFGYLIPSVERKTFLGAIWSSTIFPKRSQDEFASFTLFVGGARSPHLFNMNEDILEEIVINEFNDVMKINEAPVFVKKRMWQKAIPQYNIGYIEHEHYFEKFENENPGIFLSGNYRGGISVGDCVKNSDVTYNRIVKFTENKEFIA